jgi:hypothetical protein
MPAVLRTGGRDADCVDLLGLKHLVDVVVGRHAVLLGDRVDSLGQQIAECDQLCVRVGVVTANMGPADSSQPDDGDAQHDQTSCRQRFR